MSDLICAVCLWVKKGRPNTAELVLNGTSVCVPHSQLCRTQGDPIANAKHLLKQGIDLGDTDE